MLAVEEQSILELGPMSGEAPATKVMLMSSLLIIFAPANDSRPGKPFLAEGCNLHSREGPVKACKGLGELIEDKTVDGY